MTDHPLTEQHFDQIKQGLDEVARAENQIRLARLAGINMDAVEAELKSHRERLLALKQVYFPGR
jgi:hypothetical protein